MKKLALLLAFALGPLLSGARGATNSPATAYYNLGTVDSPQVNATIFGNFGIFTDESSLPYTTGGTLYFTNSGTMSGYVGFQFDNETGSGSQPANTFFNNGSISAVSYPGSINFSEGGPGSTLGAFSSVGVNLEAYGTVQSALFSASAYGSYLSVNANNIVNSGNLTVDQNGILTLTGENVNLARSGLRSGAAPSTLSEAGFGGNAFGELAPMQLYDLDPEIGEIYWGGGTNQLFNDKGNPLFLGALPSTGSFQVESSLYPGTANKTVSGLGNSGSYAVFAWTNVINSTNFLVQVFYLNTNNVSGDPNLTITGGFVNNPNGNIPFGKIAVARFQLAEFDVVEQAPITNTVYFADDIATITNGITLTQTGSSPSGGGPVVGGRTSNWLLAWGQPGFYRGLTNGNTPYSINLVASTNYFEGIVSNAYSAYSAFATEQPGDAIAEAENNGLYGQSTSGTSANGTTISFVGGGNYVFSGGNFIDPTNFSGRVVINGGAVDPTDLRVRGVGEVSVTSTDLTNNTGSAVPAPLAIDAEWLDFDLGSVSKPLILTNYVPPVVRRMDGVVAGWDATWTNYENQIVATITNDPSTGVSTTNISTNVLTGVFFATVMEQSFPTKKLGNVLNFALHATTADIQDNPPVEESLLLDVTNLTVSGGLVLAVHTNLDVTTCPKLQSLVIPQSGSISIVGGSTASVAEFLGVGIVPSGDVNLSGLTNFYNAGVALNPISGLNGISADAIQVSSQVLINAGTLTAGTGLVSLQADIGALDSGCSISAQGNVELIGLNWKAQNSVIQAGSGSGVTVFPGALNLAVTNNLEGTGPAGQNTWNVYGGFNLLILPQSGDLLGTTITSLLPEYAQSTHKWAGVDYGATTAGYTNNAAVGEVVLDGGVGSLFVFSGTGSGNAMYVTNLTLLEGATNYASELQINPGMTIYFADAWIGKKEITANAQVLAAFTNSFPGQLVYLPIPGVNGVPLPTPPTNPPGTIQLLSSGSGSSPTSVISFTAQANASYEVQFTTDLTSGNWQTIYSNTFSTAQAVSVTNTPSGSSPQGFYRILVTP